MAHDGAGHDHRALDLVGSALVVGGLALVVVCPHHGVVLDHDVAAEGEVARLQDEGLPESRWRAAVSEPPESRQRAVGEPAAL